MTWQPIDTAIKHGEADAILLYGHGSYAVCTWYEPVEKWLFCVNGRSLVFFEGATHWMPLPEFNDQNAPKG